MASRCWLAYQCHQQKGKVCKDSYSSCVYCSWLTYRVEISMLILSDMSKSVCYFLNAINFEFFAWTGQLIKFFLTKSEEKNLTVE